MAHGPGGVWSDSLSGLGWVSWLMVKERGSGGARSGVGSKVRWFIQVGQGPGGSWSRRSLVRWFIWVGLGRVRWLMVQEEFGQIVYLGWVGSVDSWSRRSLVR